MTGFIRGFFGSKPQVEETSSASANGATNNEASNNAARQPQPASKAFFLSDDEAKTLGNIEYMRTPSKLRRTFPKAAGVEVNEMISEISALEKKVQLSKAKGEIVNPAPTASSVSISESSNLNNEAIAERRRVDSSMDMFRNMARNLNKR
jgi:hypothetical protein